MNTIDRWFLILPDILVFFSIFGFGVLTGVFIFGLLAIIYCWDGGAINKRYIKDTKEIENKEDDF